MSPPDASPGQPGSAGPAERPSPFVDHPSQYNATIEAWAEAWEEVCDAPSTALSGSPLLGSSCLAHRLCPSAEEVATVKRQEAEQGGPSWGEEAARLLHLALPLSLSNLAGYAVTAVGVSFVGRLGPLPLSAAVLASSIFNVTGLSVLMGFCGAVDTLAGQAFGAGDYAFIGVVLQRALLVNGLCGAVVAVAWLKSEALFLALGQEAALSAAAARYLSIVAPALPAIGVFEACKRSLTAQGIVRPATVVTLISAALTGPYNWLFIVHWGLGLDGAAAAVAALHLTNALMMCGYTALRNHSLRGQATATWHGWQLRQALSGWGEYLSLAVPSILMVCCKWWSFEALILMAGWFEPGADLAVAAMGLCGMFNSLAFMLVFGLSMAGAVRVSHALGAGCPRGARRATQAVLALALAVLAVVCAALNVMQNRWVRLFTDNEPVIQATLALLPVFSVALMADGVNVALQALLRGAGKQKTGALSNILCYWLLAIPLAHQLAFAGGWGLQGLWTGIAAANVLQAAVMGIVAVRFDFTGAAARTAARFALTRPLLASVEEGGE